MFISVSILQETENKKEVQLLHKGQYHSPHIKDIIRVVFTKQMIYEGHKEIPCMNLKTMFRDRMLMFQAKKSIKSQEIFSMCETCFESRGLHFEIHL